MARTKIETTPYDSADYLKTPEAISAYLEEALVDKNAAMIAHAIGVAARARGMTAISRKTKLSRESLYRSLSVEGNPELATLIKVLTELGVRLTVEPDKASGRKRARRAA